MSLLLDTHIALWGVLGDDRLSPSAVSAIENGGEVWVSVASLWEIAIKRSRGRKTPYDIDLSAAKAETLFREAGFNLLDVSPPHAAVVETLPAIHGDPFDRMLVAQAMTEPLRLITSDPVLARYSDLVVLV